ncbi:UbiA family prenyltransferase [Hyphomicrobium sp.]|uniref:UbiA family prenyltransferase n=1 Tax=Hyphomicrobium sp. TaxID=82 RepID=UPI003F71EE33
MISPVLRLARVSNLPTIWSNVFAASALAGGMGSTSLMLVLLAMSALYTGGMILNDAFDREFDARERPERPIPAGEISPTTVWILGFGLLSAGVAVLATFGVTSAVGGLALAGAILLYDAWHKGNPVSPLIMGVCRAMVYVGTALAAGTMLGVSIIGSAFALLLYISGLTLAAKGSFQSLPAAWPALLLTAPIVFAVVDGRVDTLSIVVAVLFLVVIGWAIQRMRSGLSRDREAAIGLLIAAISLADGFVAAAHGSPVFAVGCVGFFFLTLALQRVVAGT